MTSKTIEFNLEDKVRLVGDLSIPDEASGLIIFVHGSGSSRFSKRNQFVAKTLQKTGFATLLFDLLTEDEERRDDLTREFRFNIPMLASRLIQVTLNLQAHTEISSIPVGYFGASTGAAASLIAAASPSTNISAVVSRGGRPDLAGESLRSVTCPTLLIVGGHDFEVIELNKLAQKQMIRSHCKLDIIPGATHLFEEPGALATVATLAASWLQSIWGQTTKPGLSLKSNKPHTDTTF